MKFALIGGDRRSVLLAGLLAHEGHSVRCYAMEKAEPEHGAIKVGCLEGCTYGTQCVLLPIPSLKNGSINAPCSSLELSVEELQGALWPGQLLIGAGLSDELRLGAIRNGLYVCDLLDRRDFAMGNAAITAEGTLSLIMQNSESCICNSRAVITGWGRIARILCLRLIALGAEVCIAARSSAARAEATAYGAKAIGLNELPEQLSACDCLINTIPSPVIGADCMAKLPCGCTVIELASAPGGFSTDCDGQKSRIIRAPGLPGKYAPISAARLIRDTVFEIIKEEEC